MGLGIAHSIRFGRKLAEVGVGVIETRDRAHEQA
jgi:hypothetical protein